MERKARLCDGGPHPRSSKPIRETGKEQACWLSLPQLEARMPELWRGDSLHTDPRQTELRNRSPLESALRSLDCVLWSLVSA